MARSQVEYLASHLVEVNGRSIRIYIGHIPCFHGEISREIIELAAQRAFKKGWRRAVISFAESFVRIFEDGTCDLTLLNLDMYRQSDSSYRSDQFLCEMDEVGFLPREAEQPTRSLCDDGVLEGYDSF